MLSEDIYKIAGGIIIALTILLGLLAGVFALSISPLWTAEGAAWVQAIGSIGAIVGTWYATKAQLDTAAKRTATERLENDVANAQVAFDLASDASRALHYVQRRFQAGAKQTQKVVIGTERLEGLSVSLQNYGARPIPPKLYAEVLCLQREVSYTITAVNQQNDLPNVATARAQKATDRCAAVFGSIQRIEEILIKAVEATGAVNYTISRTGGPEDGDYGG